MQTFPSAQAAPRWPNTNGAYGSPGFAPVLTHFDIFHVFPTGPQTTDEADSHPSNPKSLATSASNGKAVQVYYTGGSYRWFMAFNWQANFNKYGWTNEDNWRIVWAYSSDGIHWTVDPQLLFRSASEAAYPGSGFLVTDLVLDNGYFYMTFTDVPWTDKVYLVRSVINSDPSSTPGYSGGWSVAAYPIVGGLNAFSLLPSRNANTLPYYEVKQASLVRVFDASGNGSQYYALTANKDLSTGTFKEELWSSSALTKPFSFERVQDMGGLVPGGSGWELGFTHYANNCVGCYLGPVIRRTGFDLWAVQDLSSQNPQFPSGATVVRRSVQMPPGINVAKTAAIGATGLTASIVARPGASYVWTVTGGTLTAGQGSATITFTAGGAGTTMLLTVQESTPNSSCNQGTLVLTNTAKVQVDFADVAPSYLYHDAIATIARNGITTGCGGGNYCPASNGKRDEMAVFMLRGRHGSAYQPPAAKNFFSDESQSLFPNWIEQASEGIPLPPPGQQQPCDPREAIITSCAPVTSVDSSCNVTGQGQFCPSTLVTRSSMAVFLLKARRGGTYNPPPCQGLFSDVPCSDANAKWIEELYREGITGGCNTNPLRYCPTSNVTRGEMAAFLTRNFSLP